MGVSRRGHCREGGEGSTHGNAECLCGLVEVLAVVDPRAAADGAELPVELADGGDPGVGYVRVDDGGDEGGRDGDRGEEGVEGALDGLTCVEAGLDGLGAALELGDVARDGGEVALKGAEEGRELGQELGAGLRGSACRRQCG